MIMAWTPCEPHSSPPAFLTDQLWYIDAVGSKEKKKKKDAWSNITPFSQAHDEFKMLFHKRVGFFFFFFF